MIIAIDIPKGTYEAIKVGTINQVLEIKVWKAIKNGKVIVESDMAELKGDQNETIINELMWVESDIFKSEVPLENGQGVYLRDIDLVFQEHISELKGERECTRKK